MLLIDAKQRVGPLPLAPSAPWRSNRRSPESGLKRWVLGVKFALYPVEVAVWEFA